MGGSMDCTPPGIHYQMPKERKPAPIDPFRVPGGNSAERRRDKSTDSRQFVTSPPMPASAEKGVTFTDVRNPFENPRNYAKSPRPHIDDVQKKVGKRVRSALAPKYAGGSFELDSGASVPTVREQEAEEARLEAERWAEIDRGEIEPEEEGIKAKLTRKDLVGEMMEDMFDGLGGMKGADPDLIKRVASRRIRNAALGNFEGKHRHPIYRALSDVRVSPSRNSFETIRRTVKAALRHVDDEKSREKFQRNEARRIKEGLSAAQFEESSELDTMTQAQENLVTADYEQRMRDLYPEAHDPNAQKDYELKELLGRYPEATSRDLVSRKRAERRAREMRELLEIYPEMLVQAPLVTDEETPGDSAPDEEEPINIDEFLPPVEPMKNRRLYKVRVA